MKMELTILVILTAHITSWKWYLNYALAHHIYFYQLALISSKYLVSYAVFSS